MPLIVIGNLIWILLVALGVSLVSIGWRARSAAEPVLGVGIMLMGPGAGLLALALKTKIFAVGVTGVVMFGLGTTAMPVFTYLVFRRGIPAARLFAGAMVFFTLLATVHQLELIIHGTGAARPSLPFLFSRMLSQGWAASEALRFRRMYVKRLALGLADPVIANRFFLYAIWTGVLALMPVITITAAVAGDTIGIAWQEAVLRPMRLVALIAATALYLTFLPPRRYIRWIEARHAARSAP